MPLTLAGATAIAGGTNAAGNIFNVLNQNRQNRKNRDFARQEREAQYQTELEFWRLNNEYNHPSAQMARLREGGLNPHLVYGNGAAAQTAASLNAPAQAHWQGQAAQVNPQMGQAMLDQYVNLQQRGAQTDNFREQNTLLKQEQELKRIGILSNMLDYDIKDSTKTALIEKVLLELDKTRSEISNIDTRTLRDANSITNDQIRTWNDVIRTNTGVLDSNMKRKLMAAGLDRTLVQTQGDKIINGINAIKYQLWEDGINPNDPTYLRVIVAGIQKIIGQPITEILKK